MSQDKLQFIKSKCVASNSEIVELKFGCKFYAEKYVPTNSDMIVLRIDDEAVICWQEYIPNEVFRPNKKYIEKYAKIIGRPIRLDDLVFMIVNYPNKDWKWREKAKKILFDNWELNVTLDNQDEGIIDPLYQLLKEE